MIKNKTNAVQLSKSPLILHQKACVRTVGGAEFLCPAVFITLTETYPVLL